MNTFIRQTTAQKQRVKRHNYADRMKERHIITFYGSKYAQYVCWLLLLQILKMN